MIMIIKMMIQGNTWRTTTIMAPQVPGILWLTATTTSTNHASLINDQWSSWWWLWESVVLLESSHLLETRSFAPSRRPIRSIWEQNIARTSTWIDWDRKWEGFVGSRVEAGDGFRRRLYFGRITTTTQRNRLFTQSFSGSLALRNKSSINIIEHTRRI